MATSVHGTAKTVPCPGELRLTRLPGEFGPILRCEGELSAATVDTLWQELDFLLPLGHPALTLNLTDCSFLDSDGILALFQAFRRVRDDGQRLIVVARGGFAARLLQCVGFDRVVPVFRTEEAADLALRGGVPLDTPETWKEARGGTVRHWRSVLRALDQSPTEEVLRLLTSMTPLCERADDFFRVGAAVLEEWLPGPQYAGCWAGDEAADDLCSPAPPPLLQQACSSRCGFCPLFVILGGTPEDAGCQSLVDPIINTVRQGERDPARTQVEKMIRLLEEIPLPPDDDLLIAEGGA